MKIFKQQSHSQDKSAQKAKNTQVSFFEDSSMTFRESKLNNGGRQQTQNIFGMSNKQDDDEEKGYLIDQKSFELDQTQDKNNQSYISSKRGDDDGIDEKPLIDFEDLLKQQQEFTEASIPFTNHHIEDAIFIDEYHVIALEYIFFHNDEDPKKSVDLTEEEPSPKYVTLEKQLAHADSKQIEIDDAESQKADSAPRPTVQDGVNMFDQPYSQLKDTRQNYLGSYSKHSKRRQGINSSRDKDFNLLQDLKQAAKKNKDKCKFIGSNDDRVIVIPMLGKYHINEYGQLMKEDEIDIHFDCNFQPSKDLNMRLQLSHDRTRVVLPIQHQYSQKSRQKTNLSLLAWDVHSLEQYKLGDEIKRVLHNSLPKGIVIDANFIGVNEHIMITIKIDSDKYKYTEYFIFNSENGCIELKIDNKKNKALEAEYKQLMKSKIQHIANKDVHSCTQKIRFLGILPKPKASKYTLRKLKNMKKTRLEGKYTLREKRQIENSQNNSGSIDNISAINQENQDHDEFVERDLEEGSESDSFKTDESDNELLDISDDILRNHALCTTNDLELCFIFISTDIHGTIAEMENELDDQDKKSNNMSQQSKRKSIYGEKIYWTKVNLTIIEIEQNGTDVKIEYIMSKAKDQFKMYTQENQQFKEIPKNWFFDKNEKDKNWEGEIIVSVNRTFSQFGFMNRSQKLYIVYDFDDDDKNEAKQEWLGVQNLPSVLNDNSKVYHGRNQYTKDHIYLTIRIKGEGTTTYCFKKNGTKSKIQFSQDYENAIQDATHLQCHGKHDDEGLFEESIFSSITISKDDQEMLLKTNKIVESEKGTNTETIQRKTNSQYQQGMYPVFCYNIGLFKMIIQNTLGSGTQYVLQLNQHEAFMTFVQFNTFKDIGFNPEKMDKTDIAGNSHFAFLTYNGKTETMNLNLMFVDIYHEVCDFKLYKSTRVFGIDDKKDKDIFIQAIVYSTQDRVTERGQDIEYQIKLLAQYPDHFCQREQQEIQGPNDNKQFHDSDQNKNEQKDDDEYDNDNSEKLLSTPIILEPERGYMYYVTEQAGQCKIYEIIPTSDLKQNHLLVFEIKSESCFGFSLQDGQFLFIDNEKIITVLERAKESRKLLEKLELNLKEKDSPNFLMDKYSHCILSQKYLIQKTKIFYLFGNKPLQTGLLDMEELAEPRFDDNDKIKDTPIPIQYVKGPYNFQEANEFGIIIRDDKVKVGNEWEQSNFFNMNIAKLPEGRFQKIITDFGKQVDLTTFINDDEEEKQLRIEQFKECQNIYQEDIEESDKFKFWTQSQGKILTKIAQKWMLFDADCEFINRVNFYDEEKMPKESINTRMQASKDQIEYRDRTQDEQIIKEEEANFIQENKLMETDLEDLNLHAMSENNKYYLFIKEEEIKRSYQVRLSENRSQNSTNSPRPRGSYSPSRKFKSSTSKGDDQLLIQDNENGNQQTCNTAGHKDMIPTSIQVFQLQNTGNGDLMKMDLSELLEYKKMFKRSFVLNIKDHPEIFDRESKNLEATENRQMYIEDDGTVHIIKTWYISNDKLQRDSKGNHKHDQEISTKIYSIKKSTENGKAYRVETSYYTMNFKNCVLESQMRAFEKLKKLFSTQIKTEKKVQQDLPKNLKNNSKIERLEWNIKVSDLKIDNVIKTFMFKNKQSAQMDENIFVIKCGRDIQVAKIRIGDPQYKYEMKTIDCNFESDVEIVQILSTSVDNEIQIIARDEDRMCLIILSWNFELDQETSMVQFPINGDTRPGQHCVKGMETKRNYFAQEYYIYDLEFNIPLQNTENPIQFEAAGQKFGNQRKIFKNSSRSLSLNSESILKLAYNRMDLLFWKNIVELGEKTETISENTDLEQFNQVFNGYSMFHYFVSNPDVIEYVCKMYKFKKEQNTLNERQKYVPLLILHLDNNGLSALDYAVNSHRPKSFKCMIDLVTEVSSDFCLTKLMLNLLQVLIKQGTFMNHSFFDTTSFKPIMMQPALIVQWPESMDDFAFASNKSLITKLQIQEELLLDPHGLDKMDKDDKLDKKIIEIDRKNDYDMETGMRKVVLKTDQRQDQTFSRVQVEALDFDWLFEGNNTQAFLELLGSQDESAIYAKKSMKILIKLLWNKYQPEIKKRVLYPYLVYVVSFILLQPYIDITMSEQFGIWYSQALFLVKLIIISVLYLYFVKFELDQFLQDKEGYFFDTVNQMDITQYAMNATIIYMFIQDWYLDQKIMAESWKKALYAIACFVMWIKIYYMMRIFSQTAHFITLMTQIVSDVKTFTIMLCIILLAFANFFYVIDMGDKDSTYVGLYTGNNVINVLMEMYFVSLGNFNLGSYSNGDNSGIIWVFFILASFVIVVVFMNLLISIMGNTLGDVQAVQEQSQIQEQAEMIIEYFSLIKIDECFKNKKYVIYISRDQNQIIQQDDTQTIIMELKKALFDQLEVNQSELTKRNESMEKSIRLMSKIISKQQNNVKNQIGSLSQELKRTKESIEKIADQQQLEHMEIIHKLEGLPRTNKFITIEN